ncbi:hypothetical protein [Bacillus cereus]|uniref:hypothetical protein n=1 Tax=Bacillus cereus TaxID=1396 RepID=UPI000279AE85|nr:hypothetical protein [Bacillus cereus]EJR71381.1 hypothetical protein IK9_06032 [Bacillus cereus VD166]HDR7493617.1 hypothetical protein [Bacillus cereus]
MSSVVKFEDIFGDTNKITIDEGQEGDVFIIFPHRINEDGTMEIVAVPKSAILESADIIRNGGREK